MNEFEKFSMKQMAEVLLANIKFIVATTMFFVIAAFIYSEAMVIPMYQSSVSLYVSNNRENTMYENKMQSQDISASKMLVPTCVEIVKSDRMLGRVAEDIKSKNLSYSAPAIGRMLTTEIIEDTEMFRIIIQCNDPVVARDIANTFADVAHDQITEIIKASSVEIVDRAALSREKVSPNVMMNTILGFIIGLILSCAFIALREIFDVRIKNESDLEKSFNYPILGVIPKIGSSNGGQESYYYRNSYYRYSKGGSYYGRESK
ncbi:MAG: hypothetical protein E7415_03615 [Ruminococcaceae bacterium]|nr:hypothetical protein [Oscillospiraceae bacterium]